MEKEKYIIKYIETIHKKLAFTQMLHAYMILSKKRQYITQFKFQFHSFSFNFDYK